MYEISVWHLLASISLNRPRAIVQVSSMEAQEPGQALRLDAVRSRGPHIHQSQMRIRALGLYVVQCKYFLFCHRLQSKHITLKVHFSRCTPDARRRRVQAHFLVPGKRDRGRASSDASSHATGVQAAMPITGLGWSLQAYEAIAAFWETYARSAVARLHHDRNNVKNSTSIRLQALYREPSRDANIARPAFRMTRPIRPIDLKAPAAACTRV